MMEFGKPIDGPKPMVEPKVDIPKAADVGGVSQYNHEINEADFENRVRDVENCGIELPSVEDMEAIDKYYEDLEKSRIEDIDAAREIAVSVKDLRDVSRDLLGIAKDRREKYDPEEPKETSNPEIRSRKLASEAGIHEANAAKYEERLARYFKTAEMLESNNQPLDNEMREFIITAKSARINGFFQKYYHCIKKALRLY